MVNACEKYFSELIKAASEAPTQSVTDATDLLKRTVERNSCIYTCGNGGSALTASHFVTDWTKMSWVNRRQQFRSICLNDNIGMLTAYANDLSYEEVFSESLRSYGNKGDVLVVVSGSGNSKNIINAVNAAQAIGMETIGLVGFDGGEVKSLVDICVHFEVFDMQIVEDLHLSFGHIVMKELC